VAESEKLGEAAEIGGCGVFHQWDPVIAFDGHWDSSFTIRY
jgi:hypothetical protein